MANRCKECGLFIPKNETYCERHKSVSDKDTIIHDESTSATDNTLTSFCHSEFQLLTVNILETYQLLNDVNEGLVTLSKDLTFAPLEQKAMQDVEIPVNFLNIRLAIIDLFSSYVQVIAKASSLSLHYSPIIHQSGFASSVTQAILTLYQELGIDTREKNVEHTKDLRALMQMMSNDSLKLVPLYKMILKHIRDDLTQALVLLSGE